MSDTVIWRKATLDDAPDIAKLHHDSWHHAYASIYPAWFMRKASFDFFHGRWEAYFEDERKRTIIALVQSEIKGLLRYSDAGEVCTLYVAPDVQRKKIGNTLLEEAELDMSRVGNNTFRATVLRANQGSLAFFAKEGYAPIREFEQVWNGFEAKLVLVTKDAAEK